VDAPVDAFCFPGLIFPVDDRGNHRGHASRLASGRMPWPRLKICPGRRASFPTGARSHRGRRAGGAQKRRVEVALKRDADLLGGQGGIAGQGVMRRGQVDGGVDAEHAHPAGGLGGEVTRGALPIQDDGKPAGSAATIRRIHCSDAAS